MSDFRRLLRKETRELLRPRYVLPILVVPLLFVALGQGIGGIEEQVTDRPAVGVVDEDGDEYGRLVTEAIRAGGDVVYESGDASPDEAVAAARADGARAVIVIPEGFTERIRSGRQGRLEVYAIVDGVSLVNLASSAQVGGLVDAADRRLTLALTDASPVELSPVTATQTTYLKGERVDASPAELSGSFSQQFLFVPVVIMLVILVSGQMVMNSMGIEKEHKTLETLLTMPVKRRTIVAAKLAGSAAIGLAAAGLYTVSIYYYQSSFSGPTADAGLSLSAVDYLLVAVSLALALVGVLALALCLGIFAGDRQGAQLLLFPLSILAVVPMLATLFVDVDQLGLVPRLALFAIPFTHPIVAPKQLLFGDVTTVLWGIAYEAVFAAAAIGLAVRLFKADVLVTGGGRVGKYLEALQR